MQPAAHFKEVRDIKGIIILLLLAGCAVQPEYPDNIYQAKAFELIAKYNSIHGTNVAVPVVRIGSPANLDEGEAYCPVHADGCWLTINESLDNLRHGPGYAMKDSLPHELAHHICVFLKKCPRGNYHGPKWQHIFDELTSMNKLQ